MSVPTSTLKDYQGMHCSLVLHNGFKYDGIILRVGEEAVTFRDSRTGIELTISSDDVVVIGGGRT